jgi:hypothetical protein
MGEPEGQESLNDRLELAGFIEKNLNLGARRPEGARRLTQPFACPMVISMTRHTCIICRIIIS